MGTFIDRPRLVRRHNPVLTGIDPMSPLSVGNGEFAFTADITGLQTFPETYAGGIPLCTMSHWGWHTTPPPDELPPLRLEPFDARGRTVHYAIARRGQEATFDYLRQNPHRLHLGQIGFRLRDGNGRILTPHDLRQVRQELDLWTGTLHSRFEAAGNIAEVRTCCDPIRDLIVVEMRGSLLSRGLISIIIHFPYGSHEIHATDWEHPERHSTSLNRIGGNSVRFDRKLDDDRYRAAARWSSGSMQQIGEHEWEITPDPSSDPFWLVCEFSPQQIHQPLPEALDVFEAATAYWHRFWTDGGAVELADSADPRAIELERRIVLSQYLTAIQCSGSLPPQETGLTCNSWFGKFHLEMHWWHAAHFPLWGRYEMLERSLGYYQRILPQARALAQSQGYDGARWPKMVGPDGRDSPSPIGPLLIWQQPHPIVYAELCWRAHPDAVTLERYADIVSESAKFMASFAAWDGSAGHYMLGPPVIPAQENHPPRETWNPTFELAYWRYALKLAQEWRRRLGLSPEPLWTRIIDHLAPLPQRDGIYLAHENCPQTFTERNRDHPSMLGALGILPGDGVDPKVMRRTLHKVRDEWNWPHTWGWDYPMAAMTATRLGEPRLALDLLLLDNPKNHYHPNGHNYQRPGLHLYLPGNGGFLTAIAMMAAGWCDAPAGPPPGFPADGSWTVHAEGLHPLLD